MRASKKAGAIFVVASLIAFSITTDGLSQRRDNRHAKERYEGREWKYDRNSHQQGRYRSHDNHNGHNNHSHPRRERVRVNHAPTYSHNHTRHCDHKIVAHRYERPRYIFYRDYNTYYDQRRNVYFIYTGRSWSMMRELPRHLDETNLRRGACHEVEYYDDNFDQYLNSGRPIYGRPYTSR